MTPTRIALALLLFWCQCHIRQSPRRLPLPPSGLRQSILPPLRPSRSWLARESVRHAAVLARQQSRTPAEIARARSEEDLTPAAFAGCLRTLVQPEKPSPSPSPSSITPPTTPIPLPPPPNNSGSAPVRRSRTPPSIPSSLVPATCFLPQLPRDARRALGGHPRPARSGSQRSHPRPRRRNRRRPHHRRRPFPHRRSRRPETRPPPRRTFPKERPTFQHDLARAKAEFSGARSKSPPHSSSMPGRIFDDPDTSVFNTPAFRRPTSSGALPSYAPLRLCVNSPAP